MAVGDSGARLSWGSSAPVASFRFSYVASTAFSRGFPVASGGR